MKKLKSVLCLLVTVILTMSMISATANAADNNLPFVVTTSTSSNEIPLKNDLKEITEFQFRDRRSNEIPLKNNDLKEITEFQFPARDLSWFVDTEANGCLDEVTLNGDTLSVRGWALDLDKPSESIYVHVYVDNKLLGALRADTQREDVNRYYGGNVGNAHGFQGSFQLPKDSSQENIYVYAIGINGSGGYTDSNPPIGVYNLSNSLNSWQYPTSNSYVCGNDWGTYYQPRASAGRPYHCGIDIKSSTDNTAIYAAANGTIVKTGRNDANGNYVIVKHNLSGKTVYSFYAHLSKISQSSDTVVQKGQQIGVIGNTGSGSAGIHLHFAVVDQLRDGSYYGYVPQFTGNQVSYNGVTYYNPHYIVQNNSLP